MAGPATGPCQAWATWDDVASAHCDAPELDETNQDRLLSVATEVMSRLAINHGAPKYGICDITIRPCRRCRCPQLEGCACACPPYYFIELTNSPVVEVTEVRVDGAVFTDWWMDDWAKLYRSDNEPWPYCQDMSKVAAEATFSVSYSYGLVPPPSAVAVCSEYAYQLALSEGDDACQKKCKLPQRTRSFVREGVAVTMMDPLQFLDQGRTGVYAIDLWLTSFDKKTAGGGIFHPGLVRDNRVGHTSFPV